MFNTTKKDIKAITSRDPASRNILEVICCYPGFHAVFIHRIANHCYKIKAKFIARLISVFNRFLTGIDIHPAAEIGEGVFIDHGMGVVIGETCKIGNNVTIYQGATLGGTGKDTGKRHPTIGNNVIIGSGAKILGPIEIGDHAKIGANSVVLKNVPSYCTVVGVPSHNIKHKYLSNDIPSDPVMEYIEMLQNRIVFLETRTTQLELFVEDNIGKRVLG